MPQHDNHDDLAALDFANEEERDDDVADSDPLNFSTDAEDTDAAVEALDAFAPAEPEDTGDELDAIDSQTAASATEADEAENLELYTVTNPPDTVSVSALIDGRIHQVHLSAKVTNMSESELTEEILVLADLARQKGLAAQHAYLLGEAVNPENAGELDPKTAEVLRDFMENGMKLTTPEQAAAAQAEVFATRYATEQ
ncbi:hypothetical protein [Mycobacterium sp. 050134]|uniref:hypothetical protein n=1 Tax=Mycobacterium sp. 050134 TaxID=3096111 RepID=UPI002ED845A1